MFSEYLASYLESLGQGSRIHRYGTGDVAKQAFKFKNKAVCIYEWKNGPKLDSCHSTRNVSGRLYGSGEIMLKVSCMALWAISGEELGWAETVDRCLPGVATIRTRWPKKSSEPFIQRELKERLMACVVRTRAPMGLLFSERRAGAICEILDVCRPTAEIIVDWNIPCDQWLDQDVMLKILRRTLITGP